MKGPGSYIGKWRIVKMDQWDQEFVDLVVPGHVTIGKRGKGLFQFGAVEGEIDCRMWEADKRERLDFTWNGFEDGDPVSGRGWFQVDGRSMTGRLFFHLGDAVVFEAKKTR